MATSAAHRTIDLTLSSSGLYPPLLNPGLDLVSFTTSLPEAETVSFDLLLNGAAQETPGMSLFVAAVSGNIRFTRDFINQYQGPWPATVELRAWQEGVEVDRATLLLHDTRQMQPHSMTVAVGPNPAFVPPELDLVVRAQGSFYDVNGIRLPSAEVSWSIRLSEPVHGVTVEGRNIRVSVEAAPGDVTVVFRTSNGVERGTTLVIAPGRDIGLELSKRDLYPPLLDEYSLVGISTTLPEGTPVMYNALLNGQAGLFPGLFVTSVNGDHMLRFTQDFLVHYHGPWPAEVTVRAFLDDQLAGSATLWLHDTRQMVCARVDLEFYPSDHIVIPPSGTTAVVAAPRFYDAAGISISHDEVAWGAEVVDPIDGAEVIKHVIYVGPLCPPGHYRVSILGPNGLSCTKVLELIPAAG